MAKQSPRQQRVVERVMAEFKHGDLEANGGRTVRDPRQAIAIALSEAGASREQTPEQNRHRLAHTVRGERVEAARRESRTTRATLYDEARRLGIPGRSRMTRAELEHALHGASP